MQEQNANALFTRDLKYSIDPRHLIVAERRGARRRILPIALTVLVFVTGLDSSTIDAAAGGSNTTEPPAAADTRDPQAEPNSAGSDDAATDLTATPESTRTGDADVAGDAAAANTEELTWHKHKVRRGDSLTRIFVKHGVPVREALRVADDPGTEPLRRLIPGRELRIGLDANGRFAAMTYDVSRFETLRVDAGDEELTVETLETHIDIKEKFVSGTITSSLFEAGSRAGLSDKLILELVAIFGWDIDFALDVRRGDRFIVAYEELFADGEAIGSGDILAAQFVNQGTVHRAVRHVDDEGNTAYFTSEGQSLRGAFLRTPVKLSRITSGFSKRRYHPVLKTWRAHKGVDYGAPTGTPVVATADGRVSTLGRQGGYGRTVVLRHGGAFSTLYAHLSRFRDGLRKGDTVRQGDVIGYVGRSGLATGPHLHYEFREHGVHRDPLTYKGPDRESIPPQHRAVFLAIADRWIERMARYEETQVASGE